MQYVHKETMAGRLSAAAINFRKVIAIPGNGITVVGVFFGQYACLTRQQSVRIF